MIKKVIIKNLSSSMLYNGIGLIKFYNNAEELIESGNVISDSTSLGETENFICVPNMEQLGCHPVKIIQTENDISESWYTTQSVASIEITFKKYIDSLSSFSIIPVPSSVVGITNEFEVEFYDYEDVLLQSYKIMPISTIGEVQTILTDELTKLYESDTLGLVNTTDYGTMPNIEQILFINVNQEEEKNTKIRYLFSIDSGNTYFSIINQTMNIVDKNNILLDGMSKEDLENISDYKFDSRVNLDIIVGVITTNHLYSPILHDMKVTYI